MATATHLASDAVDAAAVRRTVADAIERLRALELPAEAWTMREIALTALRAVATALFTDAHAATDCPGALAALVTDEISRITTLLAAPAAEGRDAQGAEHAATPAAARWRR